MNRPRLPAGRKLLVASLGVAAVNYAVACNTPESAPPTSGNLMAGQVDPISAPDAAVSPTPSATGVGNFMSPPPPVAGNLMPSPGPVDAGAAVDGGKVGKRR